MLSSVEVHGFLAVLLQLFSIKKTPKIKNVENDVLIFLFFGFKCYRLIIFSVKKAPKVSWICKRYNPLGKFEISISLFLIN